MQLIHSVEDFAVFEEHHIEACMDGDELPVGYLRCSCGWSWDSVEWLAELSPETMHPEVVLPVPTVLVLLQNMADAGRDHLIDVLREEPE